MRSYELGYVLGDAVGTDNIKFLPDEKEQRVKLLENIKAVAKAVFDKHLSNDYGKFEDFWATVKQLEIKDSDFEMGGAFNVINLLEERGLHSDCKPINAGMIGIKIVTMQVLKMAYEKVSCGDYAYAAMIIPIEKTMGFVVYLKYGQGRYVGVLSRYCDFCAIENDECFGCGIGNFGVFGSTRNDTDNKAEWDYACVVNALSNYLEV